MINAHHQQQGPSKHVELDKAFHFLESIELHVNLYGRYAVSNKKFILAWNNHAVTFDG